MRLCASGRVICLQKLDTETLGRCAEARVHVRPCEHALCKWSVAKRDAEWHSKTHIWQKTTTYRKQQKLSWNSVTTILHRKALTCSSSSNKTDAPHIYCYNISPLYRSHITPTFSFGVFHTYGVQGAIVESSVDVHQLLVDQLEQVGGARSEDL